MEGNGCQPIRPRLWQGASTTDSACEVRGLLAMETNKFNPYRDRLIKRGVVSGDVYGYISFTLPLLERYVIEHS